MRKLNFLAICMFSVLAFTSCTKEAIQNNNTTPVENSSNVTVSASEWVPSSMLEWTETELDGAPAMQATFTAPLSEAMINNNTVLVYGRKINGETISVFPATIYDSNNDFEMLQAQNTADGIRIFHTKNVAGNYEMPETGTMQFRYILIEQPYPGNGRMDTQGGPQYTMAELRNMSYYEAISALGITE